MKKLSIQIRMILLSAACLSAVPAHADKNKANKIKKNEFHGTKSFYSAEKHQRLFMATLVGVMAFAAGLIYTANAAEKVTDITEQLPNIPTENFMDAGLNPETSIGEVTGGVVHAASKVTNLFIAKASQIAGVLHKGFVACAEAMENLPNKE